MKKINGSIFKSLGKLIKIIVVTIVVFFVVNIVYLMFSFHRIPDNTTVPVEKAKNFFVNDSQLDRKGTYKAISYNIGFCAYLPDFSFFMDGGSQS